MRYLLIAIVLFSALLSSQNKVDGANPIVTVVKSQTSTKTATGIKTATGVIVPKAVSVTSSATSTLTRTLTSTATVTPTPTFTLTATASNTATITPTSSSTLTPTSSNTATITLTSSSTPTASITKSPTKTFTRSPRPTKTQVPPAIPDWETGDGVSTLFVPMEGDICFGDVDGNSNVIVEFTESYNYGIIVANGGCYISGLYNLFAVYSYQSSLAKNYGLKSLPVWKASPTATKTFTLTPSLTKTLTSTPTQTPTTTPSPTVTNTPTITVIPSFRVDWTCTGTVKVKAFAGTVCAASAVLYKGTTYNNVVVEFTEDMEIADITNGRCYSNGADSTDVFNYLIRQGESLTQVIKIP